MGIRGPSLYKYFPSRFAMYDALFARGLSSQVDAVRSAAEAVPPGVGRLRVGGAALVRWAVEHPALAQLLYWRPVPGFEPSQETFARSTEDYLEGRRAFEDAVRLGELRADAASDEAMRLWTVVLSGLITQQLANEPGVPFAEGRFARLTDAAIDVFLSTYRP